MIILPSRTSIYHLQLVVLSVVGRIAETDAEIKRRHFVHGVDCLDSGIEDLGRIEYDRLNTPKNYQRVVRLAVV